MNRSRSTPTYEELLNHPVRRVLIIKPRALGDVLLSTIVTGNLRAAFPEAEIDFLTESPSRDVIEGNPHITSAIIFNPKKDNIFALFLRLFKKRYDLVFDLFCNPRSAQLTFATRAPYRVGYPFRGRAYAYTVHVHSRADKIHNAIFNLDPLSTLGIPTKDHSIHFPLTDASRQWAESFLRSIGPPRPPVIAINAHCAFEIRKWGLDHFARLSDLLVETYGATIILLHGPGEEEDTMLIQKQMKQRSLLAPKTTVRQLGALLARCDYLVTNDTGPMHIGAALDLPVLAISGPTNPERQGPFNTKSHWVRHEELDCLGCNLRACPIGNVCMRDLAVERVFDAFETLRKKNS